MGLTEKIVIGLFKIVGMSINFETFSLKGGRITNRKQYEGAACFKPIQECDNYDIVKYEGRSKLKPELVIWWSDTMNSWGWANKLIIGPDSKTFNFYVARQKSWGFTLTILTAARYVEEFPIVVDRLYEAREKTSEQLFAYMQALHMQTGSAGHGLINSYKAVVSGLQLLPLHEYRKRITKQEEAILSVHSGFEAPLKREFTNDEKLRLTRIKRFDDLLPIFPELASPLVAE